MNDNFSACEESEPNEDILVVYAYIPTYAVLCAQTDVYCSSEYGIPLSRGAWTFNPGA